MRRKTEKRILAFVWFVATLVMAFAGIDALRDRDRELDRINDPTPIPTATCYLAEDGTSLCMEP